jgi:uncharacterized membrane protein YphA (DoxX/SURF4 family)
MENPVKLTLDILGGFIAISIIFSAFGKIKRIPGAIQTIAHVGVKESQYNQLAFLEILGGAGIIVGIWSKPIGILASVGVVLYFIGAQIAHLRVKDKFKDIFPASFLFIISAVVMILELNR